MQFLSPLHVIVMLIVSAASLWWLILFVKITGELFSRHSKKSTVLYKFMGLTLALAVLACLFIPHISGPFSS